MNFVSQDTFAAVVALACHHAAVGRFGAFWSQCQQAIATQPDDAALQLEVGALYATYDFLADAGACYQRTQVLAPADLRTPVNLAKLASEAGEHAQARRLYTQLLAQLPDHPVIRRNALNSLEYDPELPDAQRLTQAQS